MLYERIFKSFSDSGFRYAVIGGIAVNLHGYNRLTGDLDIIASHTDENIEKFISIVKDLGLIPRLPVALEDFARQEQRMSWVNEKNLKFFTVYNPHDPLEHIDVKIDKPEQVESYIDRALLIEAGEVNISVVSLDDLILLKKEAGRERDLLDVKALERLKTLND